MKRWLFPIVLMLAGAPATSPAIIVNVGGQTNGFLPKTATVHAGDTVTFVNKGGLHNVIADNGSFRCANGCDNDGHGGSGSASTASWIAKVMFPKPGTYGYYCEIHGQPGGGMFGTIIVLGAPPPPPPPPVPPDQIPVAGALALALLALAMLLGGLLVVRRARR